MNVVIPRVLTGRLKEAAEQYPVVTVTGPRQSGKTTLCRAVFGGKPYANLERPDVRDFALRDPRGFLAQFPDGAVLDEVQRAPDLLSYIQVLVDEGGGNGQFILTGSQHFGLLDSISQSLAGRTAILHLLPLGWEELCAHGTAGTNLFEVLLTGGYPRIHDEHLAPTTWLANYTATYVERDVRQVLAVGDLTAFQTFVRIAASRAGQLLNLSSLGADGGVSQPTARAWLSVLETGFLAFRLPPLHRNLGKRLIKSPKLYFYDSGLLCYLLGIRTAEELRLHPLRGNIFESWVVSEIVKSRVHRGLGPDAYFFRDARGNEVDLVLASGLRHVAVEIKSGQTFVSEFLDALRSFAVLLEPSLKKAAPVEKVIVYGGTEEQRREGATILPWSRIGAFDWVGR